MIFNSVTYLTFLALFLCFFWVLPQRGKLWLILVASIIFYGFWRFEFVAVMLLSLCTDFFVAKKIEGNNNERLRRGWLFVSLTINLGLLFYFKYLFFIVDNAVATLHLLGYENFNAPAFNIVLPLGISFYTFQTISYTVDVYRGAIRAERDFVLYGCFVTFFPQLVAGPILRGGELLGQFRAIPKFSISNVQEGLRRILCGLFLKVVLADNIAPLVDAGFNQPVVDLSSWDILTLAFLFGFQIYFDFSAYSHVAIGSARLMGITFPENFKFPYMASSPRQFWRRWHISLSSWIRDYLYLPLIGGRALNRSLDGLGSALDTEPRSSRNPLVALFATWAIMGLWHGANWTFLVWGLFHAICIALHRLLEPFIVNWPRPLTLFGGWGLTLILMMIAWIPFRAPTLGVTLQMYGKFFSLDEWFYLGMRENVYLVAAGALILMLICYRSGRISGDSIAKYRIFHFLFEAIIYGVMVASIMVFLRPINQFIYFQF